MLIKDLLTESSLDAPTTIYHVSRSSNRQSILQQGLLPKNVEFENIERQPAIHGFETMDQARDWAFFFAMDIGQAVDIWQILVGNLPIKLDPSEEMQEAYDSWIITDPIPVSQIRLVGSQKAHTSTKHAPPTAKKVREGLSEARKPKPTNPKLWSQAKAQAKRRFDVWPSAYASAWAAGYYKRKGGGWRMKD